MAGDGGVRGPSRRQPLRAANLRVTASPPAVPVNNVWGSRSGGGSYGYSKPAAPARGGYTKPATSRPPRAVIPNQRPRPGGYTKAVPRSAAIPSRPPARPAPAPPLTPNRMFTGFRRLGGLCQTGAKPGCGSRSRQGRQGREHQSQRAHRLQVRRAAGPKYAKARAAESLKAYQGEQQKFKQPVAPPIQGQVAGNPVYQKAQTYSNFDHGNYYTRRNNYYGGTGWSPPPMFTGPAPVLGFGTP